VRRKKEQKEGYKWIHSDQHHLGYKGRERKLPETIKGTTEEE